MMYPSSFVNKCHQVYPTWEDLHIALKKTNNNLVGKMLGDAVGFSLDEEQIIALFRNNKQEKVLEAAQRAKAKRELYREWIDITENYAEQYAQKNGYDY